MEPNHTSDEWLMARAAAGNGDALGALLRRYASSLLTFIRRMIGDRHRAEELFQEVFLAVWKRRWSYQFPRPFRPWLFGIAVRQCRAVPRERAMIYRVAEGPCGGASLRSPFASRNASAVLKALKNSGVPANDRGLTGPIVMKEYWRLLVSKAE
jgi:RNA polymerase sigma-70 factor (ECF subfamily)